MNHGMAFSRFEIRKLALLLIVALNFTAVNVVAEEDVGPIASASDYRLGAEDILEISVWNEESLQKEVMIRPDGKLTFPLVGEIVAANRSPGQVQKVITEKLSKFIPEPVVTVVVKKVEAYKVFVIGQVKKAGQYTIGRYLDVMQVLALAGGLTPFASENKIIILRRVDGKEMVIPFKYADVKKGQNTKQNIILKSGDVVVVP
ncbi:MAG: polysaccharide biosynthesis/export family protein [Gammaproteobacteria bacterium]